MKVKIVDYKDAPSYEGYAEILDRMRGAINRKTISLSDMRYK